MKIIFTVNTYYPLKDGVQFVTQYHAEGLAKKGYDVMVLTVNHGFDSEETFNGVKIKRFNVNTKHTLYYGEKNKFQDFLLTNINSSDILINVCTQNPLTDWSFALLDSIKCKKILYMHGMHNFRNIFSFISSISDLGHRVWNTVRWGLYYTCNGRFFKRYDCIIQLHKYDYAYYFFKKHYNIDCKLIENAVDDSFFSKNFSKKNYAISVANYIPSKNQELLLEAFYRSKVESSFEFILIGSTNSIYYKRLLKIKNRLENKYGHRNVKLLFNVNRNETIKMIGESSLFLMGSKAEIFPISIVEAMAAGTPFISTDVGVVKYLPGGIIINNVNEMSYWIELFIKDPFLREFYGKSGNQYASKHMMIEKKVDDLEKIIVGDL